MVKTKRMNMTQKYIEGDIVEYDNKIMVVKEPRDGSHFDLSCPKEGLVYCFVGVDEVRPVRITQEILKKNGWICKKRALYDVYKKDIYTILEFVREKGVFNVCVGRNNYIIRRVMYVHQLQHLLFGLGINHEMEV